MPNENVKKQIAIYSSAGDVPDSVASDGAHIFKLQATREGIRYLQSFANGAPQLIAALAQVVVEQQRQIEDLRSNFEQLATATVNVEAQKNLSETVLRLAESGSDIEEPEVSVSLEAQIRHEAMATEKRASRRGSTRKGCVEVHAAMKGVLAQLAEIDASVRTCTESAHEALEEIEARRDSRLERSFVGSASFKFKSVTGAPRAKAEAARIELEARAKFDRDQRTDARLPNAESKHLQRSARRKP
ncbi:MAG: hypothetical protein HY905_25685 [Deltaproteobacteria bacterium]|nr:hypothetical protein [Deltaproteobacteria bacterium]